MKIPHLRGIPKFARLALLGCAITHVAGAGTDTSISQLWSQFQTTRQTMAGFHQEFDVTRKFKTTSNVQASHRQLTIDVSQNKWREQSSGGSGDLVRIFNGESLFLTEPGETEYVRLKPKGEKEGPLPEPYGSIQIEWQKAKEIERRPCGFSGKEQTCVVIEAPMKARFLHGKVDQTARVSGGMTRVMIDTETGIWVQCYAVELIEGLHITYTTEVTYAVKQMTYDAPADPGAFKLPVGDMREVKNLSPWNAARIKKQLAGNPAPELQVTDIRGNLISLSDLKGKTVLLDFWTTWCPPCQADSPSIEKLYQKYGAKDLRIIGISVDEERETVENYLKKHPHSFPVVLTTENALPRPYQIGVFPTYLIIGPDGTLSSAEEGDQGFGHLRKTLEKAGMVPE